MVPVQIKTSNLNGSLLRGKIDAASSEAELRPAVRSYLGILCNISKTDVGIAYGGASSWGGLQPVYVHLSPNHSKEFCWDGDYSRLTVSPPFKALVMKRLGWATSSLACDFKGYTLYGCKRDNCEVDKVYMPMISSGCFHPWMSFKHQNRALGQALDVLTWLHRATPATHVQFICLTAPGWVSDKLLEARQVHKRVKVVVGKTRSGKNRWGWAYRPGGDTTLQRFNVAVSTFISTLHDALFPHKKSKFGAMFVVHTWRSKHPLEKHLHAHLVLPNVAYNPSEPHGLDHANTNPDIVPGFHRFKPMLNHDIVKSCWRDALKSVGLWDVRNVALPDVHLDYVSIDPYHKRDRPRLVHHLRYITRRPLADLNEHLTQGDVERLDVDEKFANFLLRYVPRRHRLGWMHNLKRFGRVCRKLSRPRCPICGFEMLKLGVVHSNLPRVPHFFRERSGEWSGIPPPFDALPGQTVDVKRSPQPALAVPMPGHHFASVRADNEGE